MRVSYSGYYATLPWLREGFDSPYPLIIGKAVPIGTVFLLSKLILRGLTLNLKLSLFFLLECHFETFLDKYDLGVDVTSALSPDSHK